jgi:hypothetical protein
MAGEKTRLRTIVGTAAALLLGLVAVSPARTHLANSVSASFATRGQVMLMAADGTQVAVSTATKFDGSGNPCPGSIVVWSAQGSRSSTFKPDDYCGGGCYGVDELAAGGGRVAWIEEAGGNSLELHLRAARLAGGKPAEIDSAYGDYCPHAGISGGTYIGQLFGAGPLLAWSLWTVECGGTSSTCMSGKRSAKTVTRLVASRRGGVSDSASAYGLVAVGGGRLAVASRDAITVLAPNGTHFATVSAAGARRVRAGPKIKGGDAFAVALDTGHLGVERKARLDIYDPATGAKAKSLPLGHASQLNLAGIDAQFAVLRDSSRIVLVRLRDGKQVLLPLGRGGCCKIVDARLTQAGLFYAYNTPGAALQGHIVFEPTAELQARF